MLFKYLNAIDDYTHYFTRTSIHYDSYMYSLNKILNSLQEKIGEKKNKVPHSRETASSRWHFR
ncbi:hypothetical protein EGU81_13780 [Pseudomonas syringae pv. theae]|nr:hypothetical protein [Pseudomonas syringae pv. theae]MBL3836987.1 hypothetical protein [Pseudomonas syringae pv. theae]